MDSREIEWFCYQLSDLQSYAHRTAEWIINFRVDGERWWEVLVESEERPTGNILPAIVSLFQAGLLGLMDIDPNETAFGPRRKTHRG